MVVRYCCKHQSKLRRAKDTGVTSRGNIKEYCTHENLSSCFGYVPEYVLRYPLSLEGVG